MPARRQRSQGKQRRTEPGTNFGHVVLAAGQKYPDLRDSRIALRQMRWEVSRQKIRAYIARAEGQAIDPSRAGEVSRTVSKAYSGYVHAASPHIMDMYGGKPPRFQLRGMRGTPRQNEHRKDLWNSFYRGILVFAFAVKAFGDDELFSQISDFAAKFAEQAGEDYGLTPKP